MRSPLCPRRPPPAEAPTPSPSSHRRRPTRAPKENIDPFPSPAASAGKLLAVRNRSPLPPRPPTRRKLNPDESPSVVATAGGSPCCGSSDSGVQVVVRIRPPTPAEEEEELIVSKLTANSISILGQEFTFDSVADAGASQEDIFHLVGLPLVENCMAGFNSSIFAYGQTGSGKTYTMWGPQGVLTDANTANGERGLTPRIFEQLFSRIEEENTKHTGKQLMHHCRCSFLEIYNEQISDLLEPSQKNLLIREDVRAGVYVDSLTEVEVRTMKDVTQLLIKGLSNRKTAATNVNADSSRSHCVFTCVIESRSMSPEDGLNTFKLRRINLVDLAGSERQKITSASGDRLKEAGNINRSLLQLGNLINILAEVSQSGKPRHIPYRDSRLTFLLQESLGGNAKLAMICAVSPSQSCRMETLSTLRFAQHARAIKNKAVVNEIRQDNVNLLHEQIRELKEELHRIKCMGASSGGMGTVSNGNNARQSLRLLRLSLNCQTTLQAINDDNDVEMEIDENDIEKLPDKAVLLHTDEPDSGIVNHLMDVDSCLFKNVSMNEMHRGCIPEQNNTEPVGENDKEKGRSCLNLAASIRRGLQIIKNRQEKANSGRTSSEIITDVLNSNNSALSIHKIDVGMQTDLEELIEQENVVPDGNKGLSKDSLKLVASISAMLPNFTEQPFFKATEKVLAGAIRREMTLKERCSKQSAEIQQLNRLAHHFKHERKCNAAIAQIREEKIARLESLLDGILSKEEFMWEEYVSLVNEHKLLKKRYDCHPEAMQLNIQLKRALEELESYKNFMDEKEVLLEEVENLRNLLQYYIRVSSISANNSSVSLSKSYPPIQLTYATDSDATGSDSHSLGTFSDKPEGSGDEKCQERFNSDSELRLITLTEELRCNLEANRSSTERLRVELTMEQKCTEELKAALETAIQGHARILEQYADLQEKHMTLLATNRRIIDGIEDVKKQAVTAGVKEPESRFIDTLAAEISVLRAEREKERNYWRNENKALQAQLRDTADAVQAAGELLVRLKEAEEAVAFWKKRALIAEEEKEAAYREIENMKIYYDAMLLREKLLMGTQPPVEAGTQNELPNPTEHLPPIGRCLAERAEAVSPSDLHHHWAEDSGEFASRGSVEVSKSTDPATWFLDYDRCNI